MAVLTPCPGGQVTLAGRFNASCTLFLALTRPATWGHEPVPVFTVQMTFLVGSTGALASCANSEPKSGPADAVESLLTMVLLTMFTKSASCREMPAPSQPATLLAMTLLVTLTEFQAAKLSKPLGKLSTSVPLTCCNRRPPPLPLLAALPRIRLALMSRPGPVPSLGPTVPGIGTQSWSLVTPQRGSTSGAPITSTPAPLVVMLGLVLWLKTTVLCSMAPCLMNPMWATPPPSPVPMLPHTQLLLNL